MTSTWSAINQNNFEFMPSDSLLSTWGENAKFNFKSQIITEWMFRNQGTSFSRCADRQVISEDGGCNLFLLSLQLDQSLISFHCHWCSSAKDPQVLGLVALHAPQQPGLQIQGWVSEEWMGQVDQNLPNSELTSLWEKNEFREQPNDKIRILNYFWVTFNIRSHLARNLLKTKWESIQVIWKHIKPSARFLNSVTISLPTLGLFWSRLISSLP